MPASAPIRARTSPERFVSCVWVTSRPRGKRSARDRVRGVEAGDAQPESPRVAADLVEREQADVAVEGGVLDALRRHRRRGLLEARDELVVAALAEQEHVGEAPVDPGLAHGRAVVGLHAPGPRLDVGPVDRQRRQRVAMPRSSSSERSRATSRANTVVACWTWASSATSSNARVSPVSRRRGR